MIRKIIIILLFIFLILIFVKGISRDEVILLKSKENFAKNDNFDKVQKFINMNPSLTGYTHAFQINPIPGCSVNNRFGENWRVVFGDNSVKDICVPVSTDKNIRPNNHENKTIPSEQNKCQYHDRYPDGCCPSYLPGDFGCCGDGVTPKNNKDGRNCSGNKGKNKGKNENKNENKGKNRNKNKDKNKDGNKSKNNREIMGLVGLESPADLFLTRQCYEYPEKKDIFASINKKFFQDKCSGIFPGSEYYLPYVNDCTLLGQTKIICSI